MQTLATQQSGIAAGEESWPQDVRALFDAIENVFPPILQRRKLPRTPYKRQGQLLLAGEAQSIPVYTRDANQWTVGLITGRRIETNWRGVLHVVAPDGAELELKCRVIRAREIRPGWFDIAVEFPTEDSLAEDRILQ